MAHTNQNTVRPGQPVIGSVQGSRGATYFVTTDGDGVISCTCPDFMTGKSAKGVAVRDRVCKHLRGILAGDLSRFTPAAKAGSARALADEIRDELTEVEKVLTQVGTGVRGAKQIDQALARFKTVRAKAQAFQDKLADEISEVNQRLAGLEAQAEGAL